MDCFINDLDFGDWSSAFVESLHGKRFPLGGSFELTHRCNLACVHCFVNQPAGKKNLRHQELDTQQIFHILDTIADAGCLFLTLTGGEPMLRPDFPEIYTYARRKGILVTLFTNATLITPEIADLLAYAHPQLVEVTLYGATKATYEAVTQAEGSYERCMRGLRLLKERDIPFSLKSVLLTLNRHELQAMQNLAEDIGVNFRYDGTIWPRIDGSEEPYRYRLSVEQMIELDREDPERLQEWRNFTERYQPVSVRNAYIFSCGAGLHSFHIDNMGRMSACIMLREPSYDLTTMPFQEAWEKIGELRYLKREQHTICETCRVGVLCSQCPGWSKIIHEDLETPAAFICELGHMRSLLIKNIMIQS